MAMQAESLEVLERAQLPPAQARAIVQAIEIELVGAEDRLATKHDVLHLRQGMANLRVEMHIGLSGITRQMYLALLGQMAVLLGIAYFFVTHVVR
jgi:hypothetical protein